MPPAALDDADLGAWLHLLHSPGVGREAARRLLARFLSPQAAIAAPPDALRECVDAPTALALSTPPEGHADRLAATLAWRAAVPAAGCCCWAMPTTRHRCCTAPTHRCCCTCRAMRRCCRRPAWPSWAAAGPRRKAATTPAALPSRWPARAGPSSRAWPRGWTAPRTKARIGGRRPHHRGGGHRHRPRLPAQPPGAGPPHRRDRPAGQRVLPGHAAAVGQLSAAQPHHRRACRWAPWWWKRRCARAR
jgi:hypothetical protein